MGVKSPGVPPGLANAWHPGRTKLAKVPPAGTDVGGGGVGCSWK